MNAERFEQIVNERLEECKKVLCRKADEYATEDRLHNFKIAAKLQKCTPITALAGMMAKHTVSVYDLIRQSEEGHTASREMWAEKIGDSINYLLLLTALVEEKLEKENTPGTVAVPVMETVSYDPDAYLAKEQVN